MAKSKTTNVDVLSVSECISTLTITIVETEVKAKIIEAFGTLRTLRILGLISTATYTDLFTRIQAKLKRKDLIV